MLVQLIGFANVLCSGVLAGEEFVIRFGVHGALGRLDERTQIAARQALIRRLRILVPLIFVAAAMSGAAVTALGGPGLPFALRCAGLLALFIFLVTTLGGTVSINQAVLRWNPAAPPADWQPQIARWQRLDTVRLAMALAAFGLFLVSLPSPMFPS